VWPDGGRRATVSAVTTDEPDGRALPVLYVIACGSRPAGDLPDFVPRLRSHGWDVCVIVTPSALKFVDVAALTECTGHVVRHEYKRPDEPDVLPPADAMAIAPATFNTVNKLAVGISDTLALGLLNEAIGQGLPVVAVPTPNEFLARHPAFLASVATLGSWGVRVLFDPERYPRATDLFPWHALESALAEIRTGVTG
jgi:phosphopantothenoylcysteine synthetase/decarboxylase